MFLKYLSRKEQELFLELCDLIAKSDNDFHEKEKIMISEYRFEMDLSEQEYQIKGMTYNDILLDFKKSSNKENISKILFEIIGLIKSDDKIVQEEEEYILKMSSDFNINKSIIEEMKNLVDEIKELYIKINKVISI